MADRRQRFSERLGTEPWVLFFLVTVALGLLIGLLIGFFSKPEAEFLEQSGRAAAALVTAAAALAAGGFFGFLFGIPMSRSNPVGGENRAGFGHNTNLEQVSDWLTKILIGVTLTQFNDIAAKLTTFATKVGPFFLPTTDAGGAIGALALAFLIYFGICGFLFGYLWSRVQLMELFNQLGQQFRDQIKSQLEDTRMVEEVSDYLTRPTPLPEERQAALMKRIETANEATRVKVFFGARRHRLSHRPTCDRPDFSDREQTKSDQMMRAVPVFEALNAAVPDGYHRNYAQIGFALKDKCDPDHQTAAEFFRKAISLRGAPEGEYLTYEMALAECLAVMSRKASDPKAHADEIHRLVKAAGNDQDIEGWPALRDWLAANPAQPPAPAPAGERDEAPSRNPHM